MATTNFNFTTFTGSETAGWNSINTLINSIDSQLNVSNRIIYLGGTTPTSGYTITWDSGNSRWAAGQIGAAGIANNAVELGTKTTGNYVATIAGTTDQVSVSGSGSESAAVTISIPSSPVLPGAPTVATANGSYPQSGNTSRVSTIQYVNDAVVNVNSSLSGTSLTGDVGGTLGATVLRTDASIDANRPVVTNSIRDSAITNAKVNSSAAISYSKLNLSAAVQPTDLAFKFPLVIALSDETTAITTGTSKVTMRAPFGMTLTQIPRLSVNTASSSGLVTVDVNVNGSSILGANKLSIDATEKTSTTAATATTLASNPTSISDDAEITFDIDVAGTGAKGLKIILYYVMV